MTIPTKITDMRTYLIACMLWQFRGSERVVELAGIFADEMESVEALNHDLIDKRQLDQAEGVQLNQYGKLVDWLRAGASDADYRAAIQIAIQINTTHGEAWKATSIVEQIVNVGPRYMQRGRAHYSLDWEGAITDTTRDLLNDVVMPRISPAGVSWELIHYFHITTPVFQFDTDNAGFDDGGLARRLDVL